MLPLFCVMTIFTEKLYPIDDKYRRVYGPNDLRDAGTFTDSSTFSGCDIKPVIYGLDGSGKPMLYVVGDIATLTYSIHQEKGAVRVLGRRKPKSFVRSAETIAGTMIINILNRQALWEVSNKNRNATTGKTTYPHELPAFDIVLYFSNEYGQEASLGIFGIQIVDEGQSHSVEDTYVESTIQYVAQHVEPLEPINSTTYDVARFMSDTSEIASRALGPMDLPFDFSYLGT